MAVVFLPAATAKLRLPTVVADATTDSQWLLNGAVAIGKNSSASSTGAFNLAIAAGEGEGITPRRVVPGEIAQIQGVRTSTIADRL